MPCCKAGEFENWCEDYPTFDYEGKEYCIFHAPAECPKKQDVEAFNESIFRRINIHEDPDQWCMLGGTIFPGDISFSQYGNDNPLPAVDFFKAKFIGGVDFLSSTFIGNANFRLSMFFGDAYFESSTFNGYANFDSSIFFAYASFGVSNFSGDANFYTVTFNGKAFFHSATFNGKAFFYASKFVDKAYFYSSTFNLDVDFETSKFANIVYFNDVLFKSNVSFENTKIGDGAFARAHFVKTPLFSKSVFAGGNFDQCTTEDTIEFEQADLTRIHLLTAPLEKMRFIDCKWPKYATRSVIYDSRVARTEGLSDSTHEGQFLVSNIISPGPFTKNFPPPDPSRLADVFRRLKKIASDTRDEPLASDWHYAEKEMQRRAAWKDRKGFWAALGLYRLFSGYGEAPLRAGLWLLFLLALPVTLYLLLGDQGGVCAHPEYCLPWSSIDAKVVKTPWPHLGFRLYQVLVVVQAGLFGFATRNKMRR